MKTRKAKGPLAAGLKTKSTLTAGVQPGLGAIANAHRGYVDDTIRALFAESLDLDAALASTHGTENRWDYLLSLAEHVVGLEPHSASNHEVKTVVKKRDAALRQLEAHTHPSFYVSAWFWVASGKNDLTPLDRKVLFLRQQGITFVAPKLLKKHIAELLPPPVPRRAPR